MAPMKAKQVNSIAKSGKFAKAVGKKNRDKIIEEEVEDEADAIDEPSVLKRPAMAAMKRPAAAIDEQASAKKGKKESKEPSESDIVAGRTKELKAMPAADLKELAISKGLEKGTKVDMLESVLAFEAKAREESRAQAAKVKQIEKQIATDIAAKSRPELQELCESKSLKKGGSKDELVERLVDQAKKDGEVEKILAGIVRDAKREQLIGMEKADLQKLCVKEGVDPLMKEVMVERLLANSKM